MHAKPLVGSQQEYGGAADRIEGAYERQTKIPELDPRVEPGASIGADPDRPARK